MNLCFLILCFLKEYTLSTKIKVIFEEAVNLLHGGQETASQPREIISRNRQALTFRLGVELARARPADALPAGAATVGESQGEAPWRRRPNL